MTRRFKFVRPVVVAGVPHAADQVVFESEIPAGYLVPLLRAGHAVEVEPADDAAARFAAHMLAAPDPRDAEVDRLRAELAGGPAFAAMWRDITAPHRAA